MKRLWFALALLVLSGMGATSIYHSQLQQARARAAGTLIGIARMKADQVAAWRRERLADGAALSDNPLLAQILRQALKQPDSADIKSLLRDYFASLRAHYGYADILWVDAGGHPRLGMRAIPDGPLDDEALTGVTEALRGRHAVLTDIHQGPEYPTPHLSLIAPLFDGETPAGAFILVIDTRQALEPLLHAWPGDSATAESLLVRREGDAAVYLHDLRHKRQTALKLQVPLIRTEVQAVLGQSGALEGLDYRGVPVVSANHPVPDSPWILEAKVDAEEINATVRREAILLGGLLATALALLAVLAMLAWARREHRHQRSLLAAETARQAREQEFRNLFELSPDGIALFTADHRFLDANSAACALLGYSLDELLQSRLPDILPAGEHRRLAKSMAAMQAGLALHGEWRLQRKDGTLLTGEVTAKALGPGRFFGIVRDISKRRQAAAALADSRRLLRTIIDAVPVRIFWKDLNLRYLGCNPAFARDAGLKDPAALIGKNDYQLAWAEWAALYQADDRATMAEGPKLDFEERQTTGDGRQIWLRTSKVPLLSEQGAVMGLLGVYSDITAAKDAEAALQASEAQFRTIIEESPVPYALNDAEGRITYLNPAFTRAFGYAREDIPTLEDWWPVAYPDPDYRAAIIAGWRQRLERSLMDGQPFEPMELIIRAKDGALHTVIGTASPLTGAHDGTHLVTLLDITERKRIEQRMNTLNLELEQRVAERTAALAQAEERFRLAMEAASDGLWDRDLKTGTCYYSPAWFAMLGYAADTLPQRVETWLELLHPEDRERLLPTFDQLLTQERFQAEFRMRTRDGGYRWILSRGRVIERDADGQPLRLIGSHVDITERKAAEQRLRESQEQLQLAIDSARLGSWHWNVISDELIFSDPCLALFGLPPRTPLTYGKFRNTLHPDDRERVDRAVAHSRETHADYSLDYRVIWPDGAEHWISSMGRFYYGADGHAERMEGVCSDITERKRAELALGESESRFRTLFEHLPVPYQSLDIEGRFRDANQPLAELLGVARPEDLLGKNFGEFWDDTERDQFPATFGEFKARDQVAAELHLRRRDGRLVTALIAGQVQRDPQGRFQHTHCILVDISQRQAMEQAMRDLNATLEQRVAERTAQLTAASAAKSQFLAHMSHEIRTPMNAILGIAQLLEQEHLTPDQQDMLHKVRQSGDSLLRIIDDILDFSKIEGGQLRMDVQPFTLTPVLTRIDQLLRGAAEAKGLEFTVTGTPRHLGDFMGDPLRLEQILINLAGNAIKFTKRGHVGLAVTPVAVDDATARLRFSIEDTGIGMTPEALDQLFQPFRQADASITRRFGGTGLGLAISKRLIELMGGELGVISTPGKGSMFWFELPLARAGAPSTAATAPASAEPVPESPVLQGLRVLAVDDNRINLYLVERVLKRRGAAVTLAADGQQALQILKAQPRNFDVVLMDIQMPVMDGLTATRAIRADPELSGLAVFALTAGVLTEEREAADAAGVNGFFAKPLDAGQMTAVLARYAPKG